MMMERKKIENQIDSLFKMILNKFGEKRLKFVIFEIINNPSGFFVTNLLKKVFPKTNSNILRTILEKKILMSMERKALSVKKSYWLVVKDRISSIDSNILNYYTTFLINDIKSKNNVNEINHPLFKEMVNKYNFQINKEIINNKFKLRTILKKSETIKEHIKLKLKRKSLLLNTIGGVILMLLIPTGFKKNDQVDNNATQKVIKSTNLQKNVNNGALVHSDIYYEVPIEYKKDNVATKTSCQKQQKVKESIIEAPKVNLEEKSNVNIEKKIQLKSEYDLEMQKLINSYKEGMIYYGKSYNIYSESDIFELAAIVAGEDNTSYEGALAVISTMCNRADDNGTDPLKEAKKEGQYTSYGGNYYINHLSGKVEDYILEAIYDALNGKRNTTASSFRGKNNYKSGRIPIGNEGTSNYYFHFDNERITKNSCGL